MWFIGVEVEQETSAPRPKKILDPPLYSIINDTYSSLSMKCGSSLGVSTDSTVKYSKICASADFKKAFAVIVNVVVKTISMSGT